MKIAYDYQTFVWQNFGGISRYFVELMKGLQADDSADFECFLKYSNNSHIHSAGVSDCKWFFQNFNFKGKRKILDYTNRKFSQNSVKKSDFDIFHPTYYYPYFLEHIGNKPFVLTIHDMIHEIYPKFFPSVDKAAENKALLAQKARMIVAVSENSKRDILKFLKVPEKKVVVIYHGNSLKRTDLKKPDLSVPERFILFTGMRDFYKNFSFFLKSIAPVMKKDKNLNLVCAGGGAFTSSEILLIEKLGLSKQALHFEVNDKIFAFLYTNAIAFFFPSVYEGFGIPALEAIACGCPVVLSNNSSLPEVAGSAALYFNPNDADSIKEAAEKIIYNPSLRATLKEEGFKRLKKFSWQKTVQKTIDEYQKLV